MREIQAVRGVLAAHDYCIASGDKKTKLPMIKQKLS